jgi:hypothetical protein
MLISYAVSQARSLTSAVERKTPAEPASKLGLMLQRVLLMSKLERETVIGSRRLFDQEILQYQGIHFTLAEGMKRISRSVDDWLTFQIE